MMARSIKVKKASRTDCLSGTGLIVTSCHTCLVQDGIAVRCPRFVVTRVHVYLQLSSHSFTYFIFQKLNFKTLSCNPPHQFKNIYIIYLKSDIHNRSKPEASVSIQLTTVDGHQLTFSSKSYRQFCTTRLRPEHTQPIFLSISPDFNRKLRTFTPGSRR